MATKKTTRATPSWIDVKTKLADFDRAGLLGLERLLEVVAEQAVDVVDEFHQEFAFGDVA